MRQNPLPMQVLLVVVVPVAFGVVTGIFLGLSEPVYIVLSIIGVVGGVGAGFDHLGAREGRCVAWWPVPCSAPRS
ncbi:MAG: hypothetical protein ACR2HC_09350 [Thermoleophilaceae bacterium]